MFSITKFNLWFDFPCCHDSLPYNQPLVKPKIKEPLIDVHDPLQYLNFYSFLCYTNLGKHYLEAYFQNLWIKSLSASVFASGYSTWWPPINLIKTYRKSQRVSFKLMLERCPSPYKQQWHEVRKFPVWWILWLTSCLFLLN